MQGFGNKVEEVKELMDREKIRFFGIAETWLAPGQTVEVDGYSWFGVEREGNNSRRGVGISEGMPLPSRRFIRTGQRAKELRQYGYR